MSNKQTAVEWLVEELRGYDDKGDFIFNGVITSELIEQAKEMEKEQIKESWTHGFDWGMMEQSLAERGMESTLIDSEHYYKETYEY